MTAVVIIEAVVIVLLLILVAGLLRSHAEILRRLEQLGAGETDQPTETRSLRTTGLGTAPTSEITGVDPGGSAVSISLRHGKGETLLAFLSTGCASCMGFWDEIADQSKLPTPDSRPVIVTKGPTSESPAKVADLAPSQVRVVMSDETWDTYRVPLTPFFMLVGGDGDILGEGSATNMDRLLGLLQQSSTDADPVRLDTRGREKLTDERLGQSGVEPGDPSLYEDPLR